MHIFSDESERLSSSKRLFLVAAVLAAPQEARSVMRRFRYECEKKTKAIDGEPHGCKLTSKQREIFIRTFEQKSKKIKAIVIVCDRSSHIGGYIYNKLGEYIVRGYMRSEAYDHFLSEYNIDPSILESITHDRGRYSREKRKIEDNIIEEQLRVKIPYTGLFYEDSAALPGLQLADIIGNIANRHLFDRKRYGDERKFVKKFVGNGGMAIKNVQMKQFLPDYLR